MGQLMCTSRSGMRIFIIEDAAFIDAEKWYTSSGAATFSATEPCDDMFVDGGGAIMQGEPTVAFDVNGMRISTFKRHIPYILDMLENISTDKIPNCVIFSGHIHLYIVTIATKNAFIAQLVAYAEEHKEEIAQLESKLYNGLSDAGVAYLGKCSCMSGKLHKDCCGNSGNNQVME